MWTESVLVTGDQVVDAAELEGWRLVVGAGDDTQPRMLLAHLTLIEDQSNCTAVKTIDALRSQRRMFPGIGRSDTALSINLISGFTQGTGISFRVINDSSHSGVFPTINVNGQIYTSSYGATNLTLTAP